MATWTKVMFKLDHNFLQPISSDNSDTAQRAADLLYCVF